MQKMTVAQRKVTAWDSEILSDGRGRHGWLTLSSSRLRAWLGTLHRSWWYHTHTQHWRRPENDCTGAVAQAKTVYTPLSTCRTTLGREGLTMGKKMVL